MSRDTSPLTRERNRYSPRTPGLLRARSADLTFETGPAIVESPDANAIRAAFPHTYGNPVLRLAEGRGRAPDRGLRVGVVLSGGQAPGGHNVIAGLLDGLLAIHGDSRLFGFLDGPRGILEARHVELTAERVSPYRNTGGFDIIGSGRDKIESPEQLRASGETCRQLELDGVVVIGGDDSNTNAAWLAEYFRAEGVATRVVGVPKTIDGDLQNEWVDISFGFDTATRVYSELIGNICRDSASARKYWHFIKLMGRSASHVTLECALRTHPNVAIIAEEVRELGTSYETLVRGLADVVRRRAGAGRGYGVVLVPEGLIEFLPGMNELIAQLNSIVAEHGTSLGGLDGFDAQVAFVAERLRPESRDLMEQLPRDVLRSLLLERDAHGNLQVSQIETEKLLVQGVERVLRAFRDAGDYSGKFATQTHFLGYEGRCAFPTNFDADYTYALGRLASLLVHFGHTGYMCGISRLAAPAADWRPVAVPIAAMLHLEVRKGKEQPVIRKALVETDGAAFLAFAESRERWAIDDDFVYPGPIQYFGPPEVCDGAPESVRLKTVRSG